MVELRELAGVGRGEVLGDGSYVVHDVSHDSSAVGPGWLFVAIAGARRDGHDFAASVAEAGAALCVQRPVAAKAPTLVVPDTRRALGPLAAAVHDRPAERMRTIGVTGTNGKTMVTRLLGAIFTAAGEPSGIVGTLGASVDGSPVPLERTTPEASDLQRLLRQMVDAGVASVAIEVSSHALAMHRVDGMRFDVAAFTNLSRDHLDFHESMERYFEAKAELFTKMRAARAVIWVDDPWGARLAAQTALPVTTVGESGDVAATDVHVDLGASRFTLVAGGERVPVSLGIGGRFNVANALIAAACAIEVGMTPEQVATGLGTIEPVPGRFEAVGAEGGPQVIVDYAHTPDGVRAVIEAARPLTAGRLIVVIGAGGDRDPAKRPLMGAAAADADAVIITSDNPRSESPEAIASAVLGGAVDAGASPVLEIDRRLAIATAIDMAGPEDTVLVLGKGHEPYQEIGGERLEFDDRQVARELLGRR